MGVEPQERIERHHAEHDDDATNGAGTMRIWDHGTYETQEWADGKVKVQPRQSYALKDAAQAHRDLEARKTTGSTILVP